MEVTENELIKSMSLTLIDYIKEVMVEMAEDEISMDEGLDEINSTLKTLKRGLEKIS